jgi:hypothetical protein
MRIFVKFNRTYLLLVSLLALGLLSACSNSAPAVTPEEPLDPPDRVDLVYFYSSEKCHCQEVVGERIQATLFVNFNGELSGGKLTYQYLNLDDKKNTDIANKYSATPISLFINVVRGETEHIIAVPEIKLVQEDDEALFRLVNTRIQQALDGEY